MPDVEEVIDAELEYKFATSNYDVRKFVTSSVEGLELSSLEVRWPWASGEGMQRGQQFRPGVQGSMATEAVPW